MNIKSFCCIIFGITVLIISLPVSGGEKRQAGNAVYVGKDMIRNYHPTPALKIDTHPIERPRFPVVDIHTHFGMDVDPGLLIKKMDELGVKRIVNLSGGWGDKLSDLIEKFYRPHPDRIVIFCNIDFSQIDDPNFTKNVETYMEEAHALGVKGVKVFKKLGLTYRDKTDKLISIDDIRLDPVWAAAGRLGMPVLIHSGDPVAFFTPVDKNNERWMQLKRHPDWGYYGKDVPNRSELLAQRNRVIARHPKTKFIGAHVGCSADDLKAVENALEKYPNLYVDIAGRVSELGRVPYSSRRFLIRFQDRILFGTDRYPGRPKQPRYKIYYRFLETDDEYFDYYDHPFPPNGDWKIYGVFLPDDVLKKVYYLNAETLLGG